MGREGKARVGKAVLEAVDRLASKVPPLASSTSSTSSSSSTSTKVPSFEDVFDEESFYLFAGCVTLVSVLLAIVASRYITLKDRF